jgi:hypothetical protein
MRAMDTPHKNSQKSMFAEGAEHCGGEQYERARGPFNVEELSWSELFNKDIPNSP